MGSKTRSLGLSSLVVTSLDKGAHEELTSNGWTVPDSPAKVSLPVLGGPNTIALPEILKHAIAISQSDLSTEKKQQRAKIAVELPVRSGSVRKLSSSGWRRKWGRRMVTLDRDSLSLSKTDSSKLPYKTIKLRDIVRIEETRSQHGDDEFLFSIVFNKPSKENSVSDTDTWSFAAASEGERNDWRASIATRALVAEIMKESSSSQQPKTPSARLLHLVNDCGANLEVHVAERTPLLLLAAWYNRRDVMSLLLRRGVDARCLLRLDERTRMVLSPSEMVDLLEATRRDLNLTADDIPGELSVDSLVGDEQSEGGWSLLHYFVVRRDVEAVARLLQRIDRPTLNLQTIGGETALTLSVRRLSDDDEKEPGSKKVRELVRLLLEHGADPNLPCATGDSPFHIVCKRGSKLSPQISLLFEACGQLDLNKLDAQGDGALHILLKMSQMSAAKRLASDPRADLNLRDCQGDPCLVLAMKMNEESFACFLLGKNADGSARSNVKEPKPKSQAHRSPGEATVPSEYPIHLAIKMHLTSLTLKLVEKLSIDKLMAPDENGRNALLLALLHSLLGVAHAIVARLDQDAFRSNLNFHDATTGDTATHLAIRAGRVELTNALLDAGVDMGARNHKGETCIHVCARFVERTYNSAGGYTALKLFNRMIELDAKRGAASCINVPTALVQDVPPLLRPSAERLARGCRNLLGAQPAIHQAASCENEQCGLWLLEALFRSPVLSLETLDGALCTPLAVAIEARNAEICKLLVSRCAINRLMGADKESYLHLAIKQIGSPVPDADKLIPIVDSLLAHGAYAGNWDAEGLTPLHIACSSDKFLSTLKVLLKDRDVLAHRLNDRTEASGLTPLMVAVRQSKSPDVVATILEAGADHRLVEPRTRFGIFQMCLESGFDVAPENSAICVRLIKMIREAQLTEGDEEWRARRAVAEKHAKLINAMDVSEQQQTAVAPEPVSPTQALQKRESSASSFARVPSNPLLECNERLVAASSKKVALFSRGNAGSKRTIEHKEQEEMEQGSGKATVVLVGAGGKRSAAHVQGEAMVDQKQPSDAETTREDSVEVDEEAIFESDSDVYDDDDYDVASRQHEREASSTSTPPLPPVHGVVTCHRLSQLDRIIAFEQYRVQALETAHAWLDSDNGKKMIAQVANVLMSESGEGMSAEAALELAKRNFLEEHVKESLQEFQSKFPREPRSHSTAEGKNLTG